MRRYQLLFDTSPAGIVVVGSTGGFQYWNPTFQALFGFDADALGEMTVADLTHPDDRERSARMMARLKEHPDEAASIEKGYVARDGSAIWGRTNVRVLREEEGEILEMFAMVEDITRQKEAEQDLIDHRDQLERDVADRTAELKASNEKLESFCYSVSHDLRTPLRGIDGYSQAVLDDYGERLDDNGRHYLKRIRLGTERMARLIDELLQLSRVGRMAMTVQTVDLTAVAQRLVAELHTSDPARVVQVSVADGMTAQGDPQLLSTLLQNLLGNAWKFSAHNEDAHIEFFETTEDGASRFVVRDNGAGFDMA